MKNLFLQICILVDELSREPEREAALLLRGADLPGAGHLPAEDDPQPDLQLGQGQVCILQIWGSVMDGELNVH